ncbi:MAG: pyridoxal-phosphate dependent enzyme [Bacteroidales bacterium]|nr:pyridoxal-phosphate dependent enzyme [Bacteroidales bacterium]MDD3962562.1 pyridoxal-phosphate dependent enzyme [Bacteroidales bacterium]MDY0284875.1 pyridoxal-phosphate dependent enzyme [Bacteroidales bacterium]
MTKSYPTRADLLAARNRIQPHIHKTPVLTSETLNRITGLNLFFKCENFQKTGAFKFRGATNAILSLSPKEAQAGVATHSSGNHAQALALAAAQRGIPAYIVMPENAPQVKVAAVKAYGGQITFCPATLRAREQTLRAVIAKTKATEIHPYNNHTIICGQSTAAQELLETIPGLDWIIAPVGGGGLLSGTALACHYFAPDTRVMGAEPLGADDAWQSFVNKTLIPSVNPKTIADGLLTSLGSLTYPIILDHVHTIIRADELQIINAMRDLWERMKIIIEPSAAVPLAALLAQPLSGSGKKVGLILSGGNVDLNKLPWQ